MTTTYIYIYIRTPTRLHYPARLRARVIKNVALFKILKLREVNLTNQAIQYGQCRDVPAELPEFYRNLFTAQKIKLVKEWNDTSNHQLKMNILMGL